MAVAMGGWSAGQAIWSWHQISTGTLMPGPSLADVGYFTLPVFAFAALLVLATDGSRSQPGDAEALPRGRSPWVLALDGLIVVGALFNITWSTALGPVVHAGAPTPLAFAVTIGYPVTDLILVVMVILLLGTYRGSRPRRPQLVLIGLGLIGISTSDSIFAYLVSSGAPAMPPILDTGSMAGPVLIALAALAPVPGPARETRRYGWATEWPYLLAPYLTVLVGGLIVLGGMIAGNQPEPIVVYVGMLVVALVVIRQALVLRDNGVLLRQVVDAQERLTHLAYHDPLTGLANRIQFHDRLASAVVEGRRCDALGQAAQQGRHGRVRAGHRRRARRPRPADAAGHRAARGWRLRCALPTGGTHGRCYGTGRRRGAGPVDPSDPRRGTAGRVRRRRRTRRADRRTGQPGPRPGLPRGRHPG